MSNIINDLDTLREAAEKIILISADGVLTKAEGEEIIEKLTDEFNANSNLIALSAPQIGIKKRLFGIRFNDTLKFFINPVITKKSNFKIIVEQFTSMPNKEIVITRPAELQAVYYNEKFKFEDNKLLGAAASLFDQQCQLLDGVLPDDLGMVSDIKKDGKIEEEDLPEIINFYKETFLPARMKAVNDSLDLTEKETKQLNQLKAAEGVITGRIKVVESEAEFETRQKANKVAKNSAINSMKINQKAKGEGLNFKARVASKKKH